MKKQINAAALMLAVGIGTCAGCGSAATADTTATETVQETNGTETAEVTQETETPELRSYEDVLDLYVRQLKKLEKDPAGWDTYERHGVLVDVFFRQTEHPLEKTAFAYKDLDGDGADELLVGLKEDWASIDEGYVMGIYSMKDGVPTLMVEAWERYQCIIGNDGYIYIRGSAGAWDITFEKCKYNSNKYNEYNKNYLEPIEELYSWQSYDMPSNIGWEYVTDANLIGKIEDDPERVDELERKGLALNETEAKKIWKKWLKNYQNLDNTLFADYAQEKGL